MEHNDVLRLHAVERYVLGELGQPEIDAFEAHISVCPDCAKQVRLEIEFLNGARKIFTGETQGDATVRRPRRSCKRTRAPNPRNH